jgi:mRNA-degrading endonuclease toxin of MazEF toxin-antitoxin module
VAARGEVWLVDLGMIEKVQPAVVLSGAAGPKDRDLITVIPPTPRRCATRDSKSTCHYLSLSPGRSWRRVPRPCRGLALKVVWAG